jgi:hypothetical protein
MLRHAVANFAAAYHFTPELRQLEHVDGKYAGGNNPIGIFLWRRLEL